MRNIQYNLSLLLLLLLFLLLLLYNIILYMHIYKTVLYCTIKYCPILNEVKSFTLNASAKIFVSHTTEYYMVGTSMTSSAMNQLYLQ